MDATTNNKTLAVALVALMVGSVLVVAAPAAAQIDPTNPTGATRAVVDHDLTHTETVGNLGTVTLNNITTPAGGIIFNTTYDFTVVGLAGTATGNPDTDPEFGLFRPGSGGSYTMLANTRDAAGQADNLSVTFPGISFDAVGVWEVRQVGPTGATFETPTRFLVSPQNNLRVVLSPASINYVIGPAPFTVTVTNLTAPNVGQAVPGATLTSTPAFLTAQTESNGAYTYTSNAPAVGSYTIRAAIDPNGDGLPEYQGSAVLTVSPSLLTVTARDATIRSGFTENASWDITYAGGTPVFASTSATALTQPFNWANVTVNLPNGTAQWVNMTGGSGTASAGAGECALTAFNRVLTGQVRTVTATPADNCANANVGVFEFSAGGRLYYRPALEWPAGSYSLSVRVNTVGDATPEFAALAVGGISTTAPAPVNLKLFNTTAGTRTDEIKALRVQHTSVGSGSLGGYVADLQVLGGASTEVPLTGGGGFFSASNVTVTGDVLPVTAGDITFPAPGFIRIEFTPTRVNGEVTFAVNWKGQSWPITVPVTEGADSSVSAPTVVVDETGTLTVTVKDKFGNPFPGASVALLTSSAAANFPGVGNIVINGTGAPGLGQNGMYTFNVRPTETGDMIVYSTIGSIVNGVNNQNFSYALVRVVPAHDLTVSLSTNTSMAGNRTHVVLTATTAGGHAVTTSGNYNVYFLNETTLAALRLNGSSALSGISIPQVLGGVSQANVEIGGETLAGANLNVSLDAGTYQVYVCSNQTATPAMGCATARHDNLNNTPTFTAHAWRANFSPGRIASNAQLQADTEVTLTIRDVNGNPVPAGSIVRVRSGAGNIAQNLGSLTTNANGNVTFTATGANVGDVVFEVDVAGAPAHFTALDTAFQVVGPNVEVNPSRIPLGRAATLIISVKSLNGTALPNLSVKVCGTPIPNNCTGDVLTDANGFATVGVNPGSTGTITLFVNNVTSNVNVTVFAGLDLLLSRSAPQANETQEITAIVIGQNGGEPGVTINVTRDGTAIQNFPQTTTSDGRVVTGPLAPGNYTVRATKQGYDAAVRTFIVGAAPAPGENSALFSLSNLRVPASATVGQGITVNADVTNNGSVAGTATVLLLVNGAVRDSQPVPVAAGERETVAFDFTPNTAGNFNVTVKLSTGETLNARTVNVTTPPGTSPVGTSPVGTSPVGTSPVGTSPVGTSPVGTSPVTTSPTTTSPVEPNVPGFEVVALVGALAVALLVLRRRS